MRPLRLLTPFLLAAGAFAGNLPTQATHDWLVDPSPFKARITADESRSELVIDNGLARRVFRLGANAVTTDLQNLTSGEHLLRSISPEARLTLNGVEYPVGGLTPPRIQNYFKVSWAGELAAMPGAYQFTGWNEAPVVERFKWKKRPEWLARDVAWPPVGKHLVMRYSPPSAPGKKLAGVTVYEEKFGGFKAADAGWKVSASKTSPRASFANEGKAGEIMALPDTAVFAERAWPKDARSVEVELDAGDDTMSNAWGPGLALVADDGSLAHFIIRPNQKVFETPAGLTGSFDRDKPVRLRARLDAGNLVCEASQDDGDFKPVATIPWKKPVAKLRVGKVGRGGNGKDENGAGGDLIRSHIIAVALRAAEPAAALAPRADLPSVEIHYELYDGLPVFSKWLVVKNTGAAPVRVNRFVAEELRVPEPEAKNGDVHGPGSERTRPNLHVETDMAFGGRVYSTADNHAVKWDADPLYQTHIGYTYPPPTLLQVAPRNFHKGDSVDFGGKEDTLVGPDQEVAPGGVFESFRVFELLIDSDERERRSLAQRRMYRAIAPWTNENPLMFHKVQSDPKTIREAIDQAAEVGFELVIMSFGSGFDFESRDRKYWDTYKALADYGRSKGVALGGYSLLASRGAGDGTNTKGPAMYGVMPCLGAKWGRDYLDNIVAFSKYAGLACFENDGSYPGDTCSATDHPHHRGYEDSQWVMWRTITKAYQEMRAEGMFLNIPDWYSLSGANKCMMGYKETNWSLPRAEQEIIERQNMYDGTRDKTQTMGWMFVPLSQYHGGGAAATIEPLKEHLPHYSNRFADLLGYGVQACYRGPRLFDAPETKALVTHWVGFYKRHREVLDFGDIIHLQRPTGRDWDGIVHVNPQGREKALAFLYNPLDTEIEREIRIPLYYAGLRKAATVRFAEDGPAQPITLDDEHRATLRVKIPAHGHLWAIFGYSSPAAAK